MVAEPDLARQAAARATAWDTGENIPLDGMPPVWNVLFHSQRCGLNLTVPARCVAAGEEARLLPPDVRSVLRHEGSDLILRCSVTLLPQPLIEAMSESVARRFGEGLFDALLAWWAKHCPPDPLPTGTALVRSAPSLHLIGRMAYSCGGIDVCIAFDTLPLKVPCIYPMPMGKVKVDSHGNAVPVTHDVHLFWNCETLRKCDWEGKPAHGRITHKPPGTGRRSHGGAPAPAPPDARPPAAPRSGGAGRAPTTRPAAPAASLIERKRSQARGYDAKKTNGDRPTGLPSIEVCFDALLAGTTPLGKWVCPNSAVHTAADCRGVICERGGCEKRCAPCNSPWPPPGRDAVRAAFAALAQGGTAGLTASQAAMPPPPPPRPPARASHGGSASGHGHLKRRTGLDGAPRKQPVRAHVGWHPPPPSESAGRFDRPARPHDDDDDDA